MCARGRRRAGCGDAGLGRVAGQGASAGRNRPLLWSQTGSEEHRTPSNPSAAPSLFGWKPQAHRAKRCAPGPAGKSGQRGARSRVSKPRGRALRPDRPSLPVPAWGERLAPPPEAAAPRGRTSCRCPVGPGPGTLGLCPVPAATRGRGPHMTEGVGGACGGGGGGGSTSSLRGRGSAGGDGGWAGLGAAADAGPPAPRRAAGAGPGPSRQLRPERSRGCELGVRPAPRPGDHGEWHDQGRWAGARGRPCSPPAARPARPPASDLPAPAGPCVSVSFPL